MKKVTQTFEKDGETVDLVGHINYRDKHTYIQSMMDLAKAELEFVKGGWRKIDKDE